MMASPSVHPPRPWVALSRREVIAASVSDVSTAGGKHRTNYLLVGKHLLAGGIAGAVSRTVVSPLERMKILFQVQGPGQTEYRGIWGTLKLIYAQEGVIGYFKGNGSNVIRIAPYSAVQFASYEQYKQILLRLTGTTKLETGPTLLAGAAAGITSATSTYPLDLVRTRLSVQTNRKRYDGIWHAIKVIYREEGGIRALYRGILATNLVDAMPGSPYKYDGLAGAFRTIRQKEGIRGFYKGMIPNYLKVAPAMSVSFVTYEWAKSFLNG